MSESEDRELEELQRRLDAAFAATRPRRAFSDELWERLRARTPWWRRRPAIGGAGWPAIRSAAWPALGGLAAVLVAGFLMVGLLKGGPPGSGSSAMTNRPPAETAHGGAQSRTGDTAQPAPPGQTAAPPGAAASAPSALPFGPLPTPRSAGMPQVLQGAPLPLAGARWQDASGQLPMPGRDLPVYRYDAASGPPDGAILERGSVPVQLPVATYPARDFADAFQDAAGRAAAAQPAGSQADLTLSQVRIVYVAVVSGAHGYLEPAYLLTGTAQVGGGSAPARVLVPALAPSALR